MAWMISLVPKAGPEMAKILFFFMLPSLIFSPLAGSLADKYSRKHIMVLSNLYRAVFVLVVPALMLKSSLVQDTESFKIATYIFSFLLGVSSAFFYPAKQSIIPNLVKSHFLQFANALNAGTATISILLGAIITGACISKVGINNSLF